jgi:glycosyltransferase involved in cell wall biosynthesis
MKKRNIAMVHYQVGEMDGVSLEMEKWKLIFEQMGHTVTFVAGHLGTAEGVLMEEIYHHQPLAERLRHNMMWGFEDYESDADYRAELESASAVLEEKFGKFIEENNINFLVAENIWSVMANPAVALAFGRIVEKYKLETIAHSHDFFWEKLGHWYLTCATAVELTQKYVPPRNPLVKHAVINQRSQTQVWERKGIPSVVVPNIFDFEEDWVIDDYNKDFREKVGLKESDVVILQATRVVQRKSIELAVDFVVALNSPERRKILEEKGLYDDRKFGKDSRFVLVMAGYTQDDDTGWYLENLKKKIEQSGIDALFIEDWVGGDRTLKGDRKIYSLWDTYVHADFVSYPSYWEGWGNQLLEALKAKLPILVYEYLVYEQDIKPNGFNLVSLGNQISNTDELGLMQVPQEIIEKCADEGVRLLWDADYRKETTDMNYMIAKKHYSMPALNKYLSDLMAQFED